MSESRNHLYSPETEDIYTTGIYLPLGIYGLSDIHTSIPHVTLVNIGSRTVFRRIHSIAE